MTLLTSALLLPLALVQSTDPVAEMRALYAAHREAGQTVASRATVLAFFEENETTYGEDPSYLLEKSTILSFLGDHEESRRVFRLVPDEALVRPHHLFNRLQTRYGTDLEAALPLMLRLAEASPESFANWMHDSYAQRLAREGAAGEDLTQHLEILERLAAPDSPARRVVPGVQVWVQALATGVTTQSLRGLREGVTGDPIARDTRYQLLLVQLALEYPELEDLARRSLDDTIALLMERCAGQPAEGRLGAGLRARDHYYLAHAAHLFATQFCPEDPEAEAQWLRRSGEWDTNAADQEQRAAYFYEVHLLGGRPEYRSTCAVRLEALGHPEAALGLWLDLAWVHPDRLEEARLALARLAPDQDFDDLWLARWSRDLPLAPDFELPTPTGELLRLADFRGRWLMLDFWGTWCEPCRKELPALEDLHRDLVASEESDSVVLTIACRDSVEAVTKFLADREYTFPVVMGDRTVPTDFEVRGYPTKILVAPNGRYKKLAYGAGDWEATARRYLLPRR